MALTRDAVFFTALSDHAQKSAAASRLLADMFERIEDAPSIAERIKDLEHDGDKITHTCLAALHQTWITPLDREEIHSLITRLDDILDCIEAVSERVVLFEIKTSTPEARELAQKVVLSVAAVCAATQS